ncbi:MAG TPA: hypothetical protein VF603_13195 [Allosphingosinicella sp.]
MKPLHLTLAVGGAVALVLAIGALSPAFAQRGVAEAKTPANWSYEIRNGRRVPRGNRVTQPDGSWREEVRDGACVTVRTMSASGEYRETRQCN